MPNTVQLTQNGQPVFPATDATVVTGLATVATSGSYNDLTNKPTIPTDLSDLSDDSTHRLVTDTEKTTWNAKYTKPVSGIPASDIASGVIPSYGMANANNLGLVRVDKNAGGINKDSNGKLILDVASDAEIEAKTTVCALKVRQIDHAVKVGITTNTETLSSAEQAAAKSWLGVNDTPEIFWATYGTTTAAEIDAAVSAGKMVFVEKDGIVYPISNLAPSGQDYIGFSCMRNGTLYAISLRRSNDSWAQSSSAYQNTNQRVTSWQSTPDNTHYPSEKLVKDSIDAVDKVFWATYGTTTYAEVLAAYNAGKIVAVNYSARQYILSRIDANVQIYFTASIGNVDYRILVDTADVWSAVTLFLELSSNKVSTISGNETNTDKYPNTKATYDAIHPAIATTQPSGGFLPNIVYDLGTLSGNTTFALATPADANVANHYYWTFDTGSTAPTITWPTGITWMGGSAPTINASKHYEISVLNGIGVAMEV